MTTKNHLDDIPLEMLAHLVGHAEACDRPIADCSACSTLYGLKEGQS